MLNISKNALPSKLLAERITITKQCQASTGSAFLLAAQAHFVLSTRSFPLKSKVKTPPTEAEFSLGRLCPCQGANETRRCEDFCRITAPTAPSAVTAPAIWQRRENIQSFWKDIFVDVENNAKCKCKQ